MKPIRYLLLLLCSLLAACGAQRATGMAGSATVEYVEVSNPAVTLSRDAPATVWVPRGSVESGPPRGSELVKQGYRAATTGQQGSDPVGELAVAAPAVAASAPPVAPAVQPVRGSTNGLRNRVAVLETGTRHLAGAFRETFFAGADAPVSAPAPEQAERRLQTRAQREAFAAVAWQESGVNLVLFVAAPDGLESGRSLTAELYDGLGAGLIAVVETSMPPYRAAESAAEQAALSAALTDLARKARTAVAEIPWYGTVVSVAPDRLYLGVGRASGLTVGQRLQVYRGGTAIRGAGFSPGTLVGTLEITGLVGAHGSTAVVKDNAQVLANDIVAAH